MTPGKLDKETEQKAKSRKENRKEINSIKITKILINVIKRRQSSRKIKRPFSGVQKYKNYVAKSIVKQNNEEKVNNYYDSSHH